MTRTLAMIVAWGCLAGVAQAQQIDSRWSPWLGCWQLAGEEVRICVEPLDATGVRLGTMVEGNKEPVPGQLLRADGARHSVAEGDCTGWQQADWSTTGERLYARAELACKDGSTRTVTGFSAIVNDRWVDIQGIEIAGRENVRVRRYRRIPDRTTAAARAAALAPRLGSTPLRIDDVKEASARVSPRVLEAALVETDAGFELNSQVLRDLDRAGVSDNVIDTMIALSYPQQFVVQRQATAMGPVIDLDPLDPWFNAWAYPYYPGASGAYGYSPFLYAPFGYAYWGSYYPYGYSFVPGGNVIPVTPSETRGGGGRAVNGLGYTRIRPRAEVEPKAAPARRDRDSNGGEGVRSSSPENSSSSSRGAAGASSSGFSSGSSSDDTGRTAQPR